MKKIKKIIAILNIPRFTFHIIFYLFMKDRLRMDIVNNSEAYECKNLLYALLILLTYDKTFRTLFYYRIGPVSHLISFLAPPCETFIIGSHAIIGEGFRPAHCYSTVVNAEKIGKNFMVYQCVTIGMNAGKCPSFGDDVVVFSNSVIMGGITLGNHVRVGAGSVVCKSVPANCVVVGNPAHIIKRDGVKCNERL